MRNLIARVAAITSVAAGAALAALALVCAWQVFARYVLNNAPGWTEPVALLLLNTIMMLGAAVAVRSELHFGFVIAVDSSPPRLRLLLQTVSRGLIVLIGAALCFWGLMLSIDSWPIAMAGAPLSQGLTFVPLATGGALIALFALELLWPQAAVTEEP